MNSGLRSLIPILAISSILALGLAPSAKGESVIYTYSNTDPTGGFSWSFEVPTFITSNDINGTTISSFLSTFIDPKDQIAQFGCTTIDQAVIGAPGSTNPVVQTEFSGPGCSVTTGNGFSSPITSFGTFANGGITLTISPSGVPEPSSLLLLVGGLTSLFGLRNSYRKIASLGITDRRHRPESARCKSALYKPCKGVVVSFAACQ